MQGYFSRIAVGALAVFGVGMAGWLLIGKTREKVVEVVEGSGPVSIPLPFGIVPFTVDGQKVGSVERLVLHRDGPESVRDVRIIAKVDPDQADRLLGCQMVLQDLEDLGEDSSFECALAPPDLDEYLPFGVVEFQPRGATVPLVLSRDAVMDLRHADHQDLDRERARLVREQVRMARDLSRMRTEWSEARIAAMVEAFGEAYGDSIAIEVRRAVAEAQQAIAEAQAELDAEAAAAAEQSAESAGAGVSSGP